MIALLQAGDPLIVRRAAPLRVRRDLALAVRAAKATNWHTIARTSARRLLAEAAPAVERIIDSTLEELRPTGSRGLRRTGENRAPSHAAGVAGGSQPDRAASPSARCSRGTRTPAASLTAMATAVAGVDDASVACRIIDAVTAWDEPRAVPLLIPFLENDRSTYRYGDDWGIPAAKARAWRLRSFDRVLVSVSRVRSGRRVVPGRRPRGPPTTRSASRSCCPTRSSQ